MGSSQRQVNLLAPQCMSMGTALHELMHVIGFHHEHQRRDQDDFVEVYYENILPGERFLTVATYCFGFIFQLHIFGSQIIKGYFAKLNPLFKKSW